jgi:hypothetical protein
MPSARPLAGYSPGMRTARLADRAGRAELVADTGASPY